MGTAFQKTAFQDSAFQIDAPIVAPLRGPYLTEFVFEEPLAQEQVFPITDFRGLGTPYVFTGDARRVRTSTNVRSQFGRLVGRNGMATIGSAGATNTIGLHDFTAVDNTVTLVRVRRAAASDGAMEKWNGASWASVGTWTGAGDVSDHIDFIMHNNVLWFTDPTGDTGGLYKTDLASVTNVTGSGATANKFVASFGGYILVGHSAGGLLTAQTVRFDNADNGATWPAANIINCRETPGPIMKILPLGKTCYVYTTVGATMLTFVGSTLTIFRQDRAPFSMGAGASGTVKNIPGVGHFLLGTDAQLYVNDGSLLQPLLTDLNNTLLETINKAHAYKAIASVDPSNSTYTMLFPGGSSTSLNKRLDFNYKTGEFSVLDYATGFTPYGFHYSKYVNGALAATYTPTAAVTTQVYKLDSGINDDTATLTRLWESDWLSLGSPNPKKITKVDFVFDKNSDGKVEISLARDFSTVFSQAKTLDLTPDKGLRTDTLVRYKITPTRTHFLNIRVRFFPVTNGDSIKLNMILVYFIPDTEEESPAVNQV